ncbi:histidine kinase [Aureimonas sp. Leaf454]|nr:histidine kinase [Aureimonas sp. Leaf454]
MAEELEESLGIAPNEILYLALFALAIGTAMLVAVWLIRERTVVADENERLKADLSDARLEAERRAALLSQIDHRLLVYAGTDQPEILGALPAATGAPADERRFLCYGDWMPREAAQRLEAAVQRLCSLAEPFRMTIDHLEGQPVEATGTTHGALAVVRFSPLSGVREELSTLRAEHLRTRAMIDTIQALCDSLPMPLWLRDRERRLVWMNRAYCAAVDAADVEAATTAQVEFLQEQDRAAIAHALLESSVYRERLTTVVDADRRNFSVIEAAGPFGSAGVAVDVSEAESVRRELLQTMRSHGETLDHLTTAVARFDEKTQLTYHNAAFAKLFDLSAAYLDKAPDHVSILDQLRSRGILPEDRPLRDLKAEILAAYRATEPTDALWHLADGRTLRVFASPQPTGGTTWVYEDLTEKLALESRLNALVRLQGETLDYLQEAVAVFGQDGRLRLSNPAFAEMWGLNSEFLDTKPHIKALKDSISIGIAPDGASPIDWTTFSRAVTAFDEGAREATGGEVILADGTIHHYGIVPLPNGQTMLTFSDVSDARRAEQMLLQRNEALEMADRIKTDFVQHVNYELRSPLTNIIGFSALLRSPETGPLTERQSEYLDYISTSTSALMTIVNDILDLATIDAGIMELELSEVDIAATAEHAADAIRDRLREHEIGLKVDVVAAGASFRADEHRVMQVLFNLLSNAANFAPSGSTVTLSASRETHSIVFRVRDEGPGIAPDQVTKIFERFESNPVGGRHSGAGLGLSIVKSFVELHRGTVEVQSGATRGTTIICRFPIEAESHREAAE